MAITKKQGIAIGVAVGAAVVLAGGITLGAVLNQPPATAGGNTGGGTGGDGTTAPTPTPTETSANVTTDQIEWVHLTSPVPEAVEALAASGFQPIEAGKLTVAVGAFAPPLSYVPEDEEFPAGTEPIIASLIAEGLGLEYNPQIVAWADWPLGIQSGKYDLIASNVTVTEERKELYDFASYRQDLLGFYVKADSPITKIEEAADISGLVISVGSGTNQEQVLLRWNEELEAAGKEPAELVYYDDAAAQTLALSSGRVEATFGPNATAAWEARETGDSKLVGVVPGGWPLAANIAAGTKKGNGLAEPVSIVLNHLIQNGEYEQVLDIWGLESEGIEESEVNPPGLPKP